MFSDTKKCAVNEPPIVISDDESDFEGSMVMIGHHNLVDQDQNSSSEREMEVFDAFQPSSSAGIAELASGENLCALPGVAETEVEIPNERAKSVMEPPRKGRNKTKNTHVVPGKPVESSSPVPLNKPIPPPCVPAMPTMPFPVMCLSCQVCQP